MPAGSTRPRAKFHRRPKSKDTRPREESVRPSPSFDSPEIDVVVTCPDETKGALAGELRDLGAQNIVEGYKAVHCTVDRELFYKLHLKLRTASRILRVIKEFAAQDKKMLFDQARRIPWTKIFDSSRTFLIEGVPADRGPGVLGSNEISKAVREALQHAWEIKAGVMPVVDLKDPKVVLVAWIRKGRCVLSIDTAGKTLHKRGYRMEGHPAPIKETLASAMLRLAGYDGTQTLFDPMCGSGTIAIEGAYVALRKSPQIHRKKGEFGFEWLLDFDKDLWRKVQDEVRAERLNEPQAPVYASDISPTYVEMARKNALRARVEKDIHFAVGRFQDAVAPAPSGLLVANLPYGERLNRDEVGLKELYVTIGDTLKKRFKGWRAALLVAEDSPWKFIGLRPTRKIPLLNGSISAKLLIFDIYEGSKRKKSSEEE
jgi:putative N6-adenine-specific DNA methylase